MQGKITRLVFFAIFCVLCLLTIPLAVMNRQRVTLKLNPFDFLTDTPALSINLPLFVLLLALLTIGFLLGYGLGRLHGYLRKSPQNAAKNTAILPDHQNVLDDGAHSVEKDTAQ